MARIRRISPDFWTWDCVVGCAMTTRMLFIGLWNFADDFGVQKLRPGTIRMQVFPGDALDEAQVRAMIDELAARGLVRIYTVDGREYVAVVDWSQLQRVGKRARRRWPADAAARPEQPPGSGEAGDAAAKTSADHSIVEAGDAVAQTIAEGGIVEADDAAAKTSADHSIVAAAGPSAAPDLRGEKEKKWFATIEARLRLRWPDLAPLDAGSPDCVAGWIDGGFDLERDVLSAVMTLQAPPAGLGALLPQARANRSWRLASAA